MSVIRYQRHPDLRLTALEGEGVVLHLKERRYFTVNETFDVGCDTVSPVSDLYQSPFAFTGTILRVMVDISETTFEDLARFVIALKKGP